MFERKSKKSDEPGRVAAVFRRKTDAAKEAVSDSASSLTDTVKGKLPGSVSDVVPESFTGSLSDRSLAGAGSTVSDAATSLKDGLPEMPSLTPPDFQAGSEAAGARIPRQPATPTPPGMSGGPSSGMPPSAPKLASAPMASSAPRPPEPPKQPQAPAVAPKPVTTATDAASAGSGSTDTNDTLHRRMPEPTPMSNTPVTTSSGPSFGATSAPSAASAPTRTSGNAGPSFGGTEAGQLVVGRNIELNGQVKNCELLIVEGVVEATLINTKVLEVTEDGVFRGTAPVESAEISGLVEGDLIVDGHVLVRSTGIVNGNIQFGELEIERGGRVRGSMTQFGDEVKASAPTEVAAAPTAKPKAKRTRAAKK